MMEFSLQKDIQEYLLYLKVEKNLAPRTIHEYNIDLQLLVQFLLTRQRTQWNEVIYLDLRHFLHYLQEERQNSATARARKISSIKGFFSFMHEEEFINQNPALRLKKPKLERKLPVYLSKEDCQRFIRVIEQKSNQQIRDVTIILLFLYTGIRMSELTQLDMEHVDLSNQTLRVYGKGRKERLIPLLPKLVTRLEQYIQYRNDILGDEAYRLAPFFIAHYKNNWQRTHRRTVHEIFMRFSKDARLDHKHFSAHKLRHTFATLLYSQGVDLIEIKTLLGHTNLSTTEIYTHTSTDKLKHSIRQLPRIEENKVFYRFK